MKRPERRPAILIAGAVAVIGVILAAVLVGRPPTPGPAPGEGSPPPSSAATGPRVFYELLDADASVLYERALDGASPVRRVAARSDAGEGRTWTVDPSGTIAVSVVSTDSASHLIAVATADGSALWTVDA